MSRKWKNWYQNEVDEENGANRRNYCDRRVCLPACLSAPISQKLHVDVHVTCGGGLVDADVNAIGYLFPVIRMTSRFQIMEQTGRIKDDAYVSSSLLGGGTGDEVSVFDCLELRFVVLRSYTVGFYSNV